MLLLGRNAHAGVLHRQCQAVGLQPGQHGDAALHGELERIADQVGQQLAQPQGVQLHLLGQAGCQLQGQLQATCVGGQAVLLNNLAQQWRQRQRRGLQPHLTGFKARQVQHIVNQLHQGVGRGLRHLPALALHGVQRAGAQPVQRQADGLQRRAQLMAGAGDKQVFGLHRVQQLGLQRTLTRHVDQVAGPGGEAGRGRAGSDLAVQPARCGRAGRSAVAGGTG